MFLAVHSISFAFMAQKGGRAGEFKYLARINLIAVRL